MATVAVVLAFLGGCSSPKYTRANAGAGGSDVGTGGSFDGSGGAEAATGGAGPTSSGGTGEGASGGAASGGASASGGAGTDAGATGGGGGGSATGGRGTGGAGGGAAGSSGRGGSAGGAVGSGGTNTGGANTGGANTGGANTGGANTGGMNVGGANTGGANAGGGGAGGASVPAGAILYYAFDESAGTQVADGSVNARHGTVSGGGTFSPGVVKNGLTFAGGMTAPTNTYVAIPAGLLSDARNMTISVWVKVTTDKPWQRILDFHKSSTTGYMFLTPHAGTTSFARFGITTTTYSAEQVIDVPMLPVGVWKHLALVFGTTGASFFVDGVKVTTNTGLNLRPADIGPFTNQWLGRSAFTADPYFAGQLDELRIYDRALSDAEVATLFSLR